jgi:hypothetical protein
VIAARVNEWTEEKSVTLKLSGAVSESEITAAALTSASGAVDGKWISAFGGVEWTFVPSSPLSSGEYTLTVPDTVSGDNGKRIDKAFTYTFALGGRQVASLGSASDSALLVLNKTDAEVYKLAFYAEGGINAVSAFAEDGELLGTVNVCGEGLYYIDLTDRICASKETSIKVYLKAENKANENVFSASLDTESGSVRYGALAKHGIANAPDGTAALEISGYKTVTKFPTEEFYAYQQPTIIADSIIADRELVSSDMGRSFKISVRIFDTVSRYVRVSINNCTSRDKSIADYRASTYNFVTEAGKWNDISITHTVYEPMYGDLALDRKVLTVSCYGKGNVDTPMYIRDLCSVELHAPVAIGEAYLISRAQEQVLPDGMSEIVCPESPWLNTKKK